MFDLQWQRVVRRVGQVGLEAVDLQHGVPQGQQLGVPGHQVGVDLGEAGEPVPDEDVLPDGLGEGQMG